MGYEASRSKTERYPGNDRYESRPGGDRSERSNTTTTRPGGRYGSERNVLSQEARPGQGFRNARYDLEASETISAADESDTWRKQPTIERRELNPPQRSNYEAKASSEANNWRRTPNRTTSSINVQPVSSLYVPPSRRN